MALYGEVLQAVFGNPQGDYECPDLLVAVYSRSSISWSLDHQIWIRETNAGRDYEYATANSGDRFANEVFEIRAYVWDFGGTGAWGSYEEGDERDPETLLPNFWWRDLEVRWYKCAVRGATVNRDDRRQRDRPPPARLPGQPGAPGRRGGGLMGRLTDGFELLAQGFFSLGEGLASLFDFSGTLPASRQTEAIRQRVEAIRREARSQSTEEALRSDWEAVGRDFETVLGRSLDELLIALEFAARV
jgi:hypothetical protein